MKYANPEFIEKPPTQMLGFDLILDESLPPNVIKIRSLPAPELMHVVLENADLKAKLAIAVETLQGIADMPDYDQDNEHRLRHLAQAALVRIREG